MVGAVRRSSRCVGTCAATSTERPIERGSVTRCDGHGVNRGNGSGSRASPDGRLGAALPRVRGPLDRADRRSPGTLAGHDQGRPRSRRTSTTQLRLTKNLRIAPRVNAGLSATCAAYGACRGARSTRASAGQNARGRGMAGQPPGPAGARCREMRPSQQRRRRGRSSIRGCATVSVFAKDRVEGELARAATLGPRSASGAFGGTTGRDCLCPEGTVSWSARWWLCFCSPSRTPPGPAPSFCDSSVPCGSDAGDELDARGRGPFRPLFTMPKEKSSSAVT